MQKGGQKELKLNGPTKLLCSWGWHQGQCTYSQVLVGACPTSCSRFSSSVNLFFFLPADKFSARTGQPPATKTSSEVEGGRADEEGRGRESIPPQHPCHVKERGSNLCSRQRQHTAPLCKETGSNAVHVWGGWCRGGGGWLKAKYIMLVGAGAGGGGILLAVSHG